MCIRDRAQALRAAALVETPAPISAAPKPARYPEWMRALSLAGLCLLYTSTTVAALAERNGLADPSVIYVGQILYYR